MGEWLGWSLDAKHSPVLMLQLEDKRNPMSVYWNSAALSSCSKALFQQNKPSPWSLLHLQQIWWTFKYKGTVCTWTQHVSWDIQSQVSSSKYMRLLNNTKRTNIQVLMFTVSLGSFPYPYCTHSKWHNLPKMALFVSGIFWLHVETCRPSLRSLCWKHIKISRLNCPIMLGSPTLHVNARYEQGLKPKELNWLLVKLLNIYESCARDASTRLFPQLSHPIYESAAEQRASPLSSVQYRASVSRRWSRGVSDTGQRWLSSLAAAVTWSRGKSWSWRLPPEATRTYLVGFQTSSMTWGLRCVEVVLDKGERRRRFGLWNFFFKINLKVIYHKHSLQLNKCEGSTMIIELGGENLNQVQYEEWKLYSEFRKSSNINLRWFVSI